MNEMTQVCRNRGTCLLKEKSVFLRMLRREMPTVPKDTNKDTCFVVNTCFHCVLATTKNVLLSITLALFLFIVC